MVQNLLHSRMQLSQLGSQTSSFPLPLCRGSIVHSHTGPRVAVVATTARILAMLLIYPRDHMRFSLVKDTVIH